MKLIVRDDVTREHHEAGCSRSAKLFSYRTERSAAFLYSVYAACAAGRPRTRVWGVCRWASEGPYPGVRADRR